MSPKSADKDPKSQWIVGITDYIRPPADIEQKAFPEADLQFLPDPDKSEANRDAWRRADALLTWHWPIDKSTLTFLDSCKIVVRYGVGCDTVDVAALAERDIPLCNTPDYGTEEVADTACAMILDGLRKVLLYDRVCREYPEGTWQDKLLKPHQRTSDQCIGVVGVGRIGTAVVNRMKPFRCRILGYDPYQPSGHEKAIGYERTESLEELLEASHIVTAHCPLTDETRGMIDTQFFERMQPGSALVNTARGAILASLDCLEAALRSEHLAWAGLDVLPFEPPRDHSLLQAWRDDAPWLRGRLTINPHAAFYSERGSYEMRYKAAQTARLYLLESKLRNHIRPGDSA